jgi:hypothetical protein
MAMTPFSLAILHDAVIIKGKIPVFFHYQGIRLHKPALF